MIGVRWEMGDGRWEMIGGKWEMRFGRKGKRERHAGRLSSIFPTQLSFIDPA